MHFLIRNTRMRFQSSDYKNVVAKSTGGCCVAVAKIFYYIFQRLFTLKIYSFGEKY